MPEEPTISEPVPAAQEPAPEVTERAPAEPIAAAEPADTVAETPAAPPPLTAKQKPERKARKPSADEATAAAPSEDIGNGAATATAAGNKRWYVVKVQSGREESIKEAIERRVKIEGLEEYFGQILIPTEKIVEMRGGKRVTRQRKLFPGYLMVEVEYNDRILYLFRETSGVGDFVGGSVNHPPPPMPAKEIDRLIRPVGAQPEKVKKEIFERGDKVKVKEGPFAGMEGEVKEVLEAKDKVRVELTIFGRAVPVELEYWAVEKT
jgi:transcriptional antiterminator NusG